MEKCEDTKHLICMKKQKKLIVEDEVIIAHAVEKTLTALLQEEEHFSASYEVQNTSSNEYGGVLETQIMALPRFVLHPKE